MGVLRRVMVWLSWCAALTASLNLLMVSRLSSNPFLRHRHHATQASTTPGYLNEKVYLKGEVYLVRPSAHYQKRQQNRSGLRMLSSMYTYLPTVRVQYSSKSPQLKNLISKLKNDITKRGITYDPWDLAKKWAKGDSLVPETARGLGDVLAAMSGAPIRLADNCNKGTQLKLCMRLQGGQTVIFKPKRYPRDVRLDGTYSGFDRHIGEIAAFQLSRVLDFRNVPLTVGRNVSLTRQIIPVSSSKLFKTFYTNKENQVCFYGMCHYCKKEQSVCQESHLLEGSVILWLPKRMPLQERGHPWARSYRDNLQPWEKDANFCKKFLKSSRSSLVLEFMDAAVFDFLIQNGDRHHYAYVPGSSSNSFILLDNGKSFGNPHVDHMDILAPLLQCCRLRQITYDKLVFLSGGGLSQIMRELLELDPLKPVLTEDHLRAMDRRLLHILAALSMCREQRDGWHNVLY